MAGLRLFAGCYERFLFGFDCPESLMTAASTSSSGQPIALERKCTFAAHKQAVKCVAAAGPFLASGGADDTIHLYDLQRDKDLGFLMNPGDGAVPCLEFFTPSSAGRTGAGGATHLFSGSADGSISVWQSGGGWEHLKTMRGHKGSINGLAVHQSGRLALSVARDSHIRMWNLLKGRCSYTAKLEVEGDAVRFSPGGDAYALICGSKVTVHLTSGEGGILATLPHTRCVLCMTQSSDGVLLTGVEDGSLKVWDLRASSCSHTLERCHTSRIRGLVTLKSPPGGSSIPEMFATASSDGLVKVWDARMLSSPSSSQQKGGTTPVCLASASTNARITCLCTVQKQQPKQQAKGAGAAPAGVASTAGGDRGRSHVNAETTGSAPSKPKQPLAKATDKAQATHGTKDLAQTGIKAGSKIAASTPRVPPGEELATREDVAAARAKAKQQHATKPPQSSMEPKAGRVAHAAGPSRLHKKGGTQAVVSNLDSNVARPVMGKGATTKMADKSDAIRASYESLEAECALTLQEKAKNGLKTQKQGLNRASAVGKRQAEGQSLGSAEGQVKRAKPGGRLSDMWVQSSD